MKISEEQQRWLVSSFNTFLTAFLITISPYIDQINETNIQTAFVGSIVFVGVRAGIKALVELYLNKQK